MRSLGRAEKTETSSDNISADVFVYNTDALSAKIIEVFFANDTETASDDTETLTAEFTASFPSDDTETSLFEYSDSDSVS